MISVIIPVYNEERTIPSIIEIVRTWGKAKEIIVVNDGSTDRTLAALRQFKNSIVLLSRTRNHGKGKSMMEGVRKARGDLIMFLDGDVVGLTHADLNRMTAPVLNNLADMVIAVTNCWGVGSFEPFNVINGERVLRRDAIIDHINKFAHVGNGVEFIINEIHKHKRIKTIKLPHVYILSKFEKVSPPEAIVQYVKEAKQFVTAILQIQADGITPHAKKLLRVSQAYLKHALDYFQYG